ncbi:unnamed protein product [Phyllotreta striolata]|uniref:SHSP domain-containing protein n=1 Tax=Phyllotreta striolata TaxID=444603 RepID=A0A9N9TL38_PHYSR|nr:unnamed protein product [Phyllotreta striolata]
MWQHGFCQDNMALLPLLIDDSWLAPRRDTLRRNLCDVRDLFHPLSVVSNLLDSPEHLRDLHAALQQAAGAQVTIDKDRFQANFDVQHFKPEEITVKVTGDNAVTVEAKHEEKQDEHGQIYRHFVRKYVLPEKCDVSRLESRLSSDGVLTITAPTIGEKVEHKAIPITQTGKPARSVEKKRAEEPRSRSE